jgi:AcrR family transcriptional regulator
MATQGERRAETRERLLAAAAELFAERAGRTSGAVYDHFGGKPGLLFALLEGWTDAAAEVIGAEVAAATTLEGRLEAIWRNVVSPPQGDGGRWILLEHELWSYAARDEQARAHLARRYRAAWAGVDESLQDWARQQDVEPPAPTGAAIIGALLGLEMMRRIDPDAIDTDTAVAVLRGAVGARPAEVGGLR